MLWNLVQLLSKYSSCSKKIVGSSFAQAINRTLTGDAAPEFHTMCFNALEAGHRACDLIAAGTVAVIGLASGYDHDHNPGLHADTGTGHHDPGGLTCNYESEPVSRDRKAQLRDYVNAHSGGPSPRRR